MRTALSRPLIAVVAGMSACLEPSKPPSELPDLGGGVRLLWRKVYDDDRISFTRPATDGRRVYLRWTSGDLAAFDVRDGSTIWQKPIETDGGPANVVLSDGRVIVVGSVAVARDAATGDELWRFRADSSASFSESSADDRSFYFGDTRHRVYALDVATGALRWKTDVGPDWAFRGVTRGVSVSGDTVYAAVNQYLAQNGFIQSGWIFALDRHSGQILASYRNGGDNDQHDIFAAPRVYGNLLLAVDFFTSDYIGVNRFTMQEVWRQRGPRHGAGAWNSPQVVDGIAYGASADRFVTAMNPATGAIIWRYDAPGSNHALAVCGSRILVNYSFLGILDRATGEHLAQRYDTSDEFLMTSFAVTGDTAFVKGTRAAYAFICPR